MPFQTDFNAVAPDLFEAALLLRLVSQLEKFKTRRVDYVFLNYLDRETFERQRGKLIQSWEELLDEVLTA
jgi:hypothetical protein